MTIWQSTINIYISKYLLQSLFIKIVYKVKGKKQKKSMLTTEHGYKILSVESHCKSKCSSL